MYLINFAGTPPTTVFAATSFVTTAPAPTTALSPMVTPCRITILETYASREAYESHIASPHFQKYKRETLHMVKALVLSDQTPLDSSNRINNFIR